MRSVIVLYLQLSLLAVIMIQTYIHTNADSVTIIHINIILIF